MSTVSTTAIRSYIDFFPALENGERLTQPEFHRRYKTCPDGLKFELIGGKVYMSSPVSQPHGTNHSKLNLVLGIYEAATPGTELSNNTTAILGEFSEPQPDLMLRILQECGGRSRLRKKMYVVGAPELAAEIALSTRAIDLFEKKEDYRAAGVQEYMVLCLKEQKLYWFNFKLRRTIVPNAQGIHRSRAFPGLWIDGAALLAGDSPRLIEVAQQGVVSTEHAEFVAKLAAARQHR